MGGRRKAEKTRGMVLIDVLPGRRERSETLSRRFRARRVAYVRNTPLKRGCGVPLSPSRSSAADAIGQAADGQGSDESSSRGMMITPRPQLDIGALSLGDAALPSSFRQQEVLHIQRSARTDFCAHHRSLKAMSR